MSAQSSAPARKSGFLLKVASFVACALIAAVVTLIATAGYDSYQRQQIAKARDDSPMYLRALQWRGHELQGQVAIAERNAQRLANGQLGMADLGDTKTARIAAKTAAEFAILARPTTRPWTAAENEQFAKNEQLRGHLNEVLTRAAQPPAEAPARRL